MGFSICWLAIREDKVSTKLSQLKLSRAGIFSAFPESEPAGILMPTGWYLIYYDHGAHHFDEASLLKQISASVEIVTCMAEEHCMQSVASGWSGGRRVWRVEHDANLGLRHLAAEGRLPEPFGPIRDDMYARANFENEDSRACDYLFEIPVRLAKAITGFKHDEMLDGILGKPYEVLTATIAR